MNHLYIIRLDGGRHIVRDVLADSYLKLYQINSNGTELPVWCHSLTAAAKYDSEEINDIKTRLEKLGYKVHSEGI